MSTADILLNLASAESEVMKRNFCGGSIDHQTAVTTLIDCHAMLVRAMELMSLLGIKDPPKRRLGTLAEDIPKELENLKNWGTAVGLIEIEETIEIS